ncbi:MAG: serine/threonine protein kinase, partial [Myxococcales bacterium]|nr:serine/threonine protein kinase [Myxococcales bacterium]
MTQLCPLCRTRYDEPLGKCKKDGTILIEDRTGQSLAGRYTFRELLGIGSNGATVWEAWQEDADRRVAVRLLYLRENERDYFLEASGQTAALDHPRIGRIYDYNKAEDGLACNVMELIDGRPLAGELGDGRQMAVADALPLILQVLDALDYAHRRNILHLDLKPGNIFLVHGADGEPPKVKVVDFALAPPQSVIDRYGGPTPGDDRVPEALRYTAPELLANGRASPQSDIYSVGCLLFQMIAGAPPFPQTSGTLVARGHLTHPPPSPFRIQALGEMPPALPEILERALEKAPTRRFESAAAMRSALEAARRGESIADVSDEEATIARVKVDDLVTSAPIVGPKSGGPSVVIDLREAAPSRGANKQILVAT